MSTIKDLAKNIVCNTWRMATSNYSLGLTLTFGGIAMISLSILSILNKLDVLPEEIENKFLHIAGLFLIGCLSFFIHHLYYTWANKNERNTNDVPSDLVSTNNPLTLAESKAVAWNKERENLYKQLDELKKLPDEAQDKEIRIKQTTALIAYFSEKLNKILPSSAVQSQQT